MTESYTGTKFQSVFEEKVKVDNDKIDELNKWCKKFSELGLAPKCGGGCAGNLSFRTIDGFIITASGVDLGNLSDEDFVEVKGIDPSAKKVFVKGVKEPSSESFLHNEIYQRRDDVEAVFHGHDLLVLEKNDKLSLPITAVEKPYGTIELMWEVVNVLGDKDYILIKNHGFLALGKTLQEAGKEALKQHHNAFKISEIEGN